MATIIEGIKGDDWFELSNGDTFKLGTNPNKLYEIVFSGNLDNETFVGYMKTLNDTAPKSIAIWMISDMLSNGVVNIEIDSTGGVIWDKALNASGEDINVDYCKIRII